MNMAIRYRIIIFFISASTLFFSSCGNKNLESQSESDEKSHKIAVRTETASRQTLRSYIELNGSIEAKNSVKVYPNIAGKIAGSKVNLGQKVNKGEALLYVDPSTPGSVFALSPVISPIAGSVISIPPKAGTKVSTETEVLTIGDLSELQMKAYVSEKYFGLLKEDLEAEVRVAAFPGEVFSARVQGLSPVVDENSRTVETILKFPEDEKRITAGMFGKIKLYLKDYQDVLSAPENAVAERAGKKILFIAGSDGKAQEREVTLGVTVDGRCEITTGLSEGDKIITDGISSLQDGIAISIIE